MGKFIALTKKEIKELITPQLVVPLIVMVLVFAGIGGILSDEAEKSGAAKPLWLIDQDQSAASEDAVEYLDGNGYSVDLFQDDIGQALKAARRENITGIVLIPEGFGRALSAKERPEIKAYRLADNFSLGAIRSQSQIDAAIGSLNVFVQSRWLKAEKSGIPLDKFIQPIDKVEYAVVGDKTAQAPFMAVIGFVQQQATFVPIILFMVIVVASQMVASAVASEKESKTLETLLSLPIGRKSIVFAKLLAAGLVSFLFAGFYLYGFSRYMGGIAGQMPGAGELQSAIGPALETLGLTFNVFDYSLLGISLFLGILAALAIALMLGLLAENVKGVQAVVTPLMLLILVPYLITMFVDLNQAAPILKYIVYAIPFSYPFLAIQKLLIGEYSFVLFGLIYQLLFFLAVVMLTARIFSTDKILTMRLGRKKNK